MQQFFAKLVTSSADPEKYALTAKAFLVGIIPMIAFVAPIVCAVGILCIDPSQLPAIVDQITALIVGVLTVVSSVMAIIGLGRKLWLGRWSHPAVV